MKHDWTTIRSINGQVSHDAVTASEFIKECLAEIDVRLGRLAGLDNLSVVLDDTTFSGARSDLAGIRHIAQVFKRAADFQKNGGLGDAFSNATKTVAAKEEEAEGIFATLKAMYP